MTQTTAFLLTLLIEVPIVLIVVGLRRWAPGRLREVALVAVAASCLTHPVLWMAADHVQTTPSLLAAELLITVVEAGVYGVGLGLAAVRALVVSSLANGSSLGIGLLLHALAWA